MYILMSCGPFNSISNNANTYCNTNGKCLYIQHVPKKNDVIEEFISNGFNSYNTLPVPIDLSVDGNNIEFVGNVGWDDKFFMPIATGFVDNSANPLDSGWNAIFVDPSTEFVHIWDDRIVGDVGNLLAAGFVGNFANPSTDFVGNWDDQFVNPSTEFVGDVGWNAIFVDPSTEFVGDVGWNAIFVDPSTGFVGNFANPLVSGWNDIFVDSSATGFVGNFANPTPNTTLFPNTKSGENINLIEYQTAGNNALYARTLARNAITSTNSLSINVLNAIKSVFPKQKIQMYRQMFNRLIHELEYAEEIAYNSRNNLFAKLNKFLKNEIKISDLIKQLNNTNKVTGTVMEVVNNVMTAISGLSQSLKSIKDDINLFNEALNNINKAFDNAKTALNKFRKSTYDASGAYIS